MTPIATVMVHVVPRARQTGVVGRHGDAIRIRVAAPPVDGAANEELVRHIADRLKVPRRAVTIVQGLTGRRKTVTVEGLTTNEVVRQLIADS